jgi:hypothetical protein
MKHTLTTAWHWLGHADVHEVTNGEKLFWSAVVTLIAYAVFSAAVIPAWCIVVAVLFIVDVIWTM